MLSVRFPVLQSLDKSALFEQLCSGLNLRLEELMDRAQSAAESATHAEARPENDKDTRAIEGSYLARGQAARVVEAERDLQLLRSLELVQFGDDDLISATALVLLEDEETEQRLVFLLPAGGGMVLDAGAHQVFVVTPASPLGRALLERSVDDEVEVRSGGKSRYWTISGLR